MGNKIEADSGAQSGVTTAPAKRVKELERDNRELKRANEILRRACLTKCFGHNALVETINGFYKTEAIHKDGPWRGMDDVAQATSTWVSLFNHRRSPREVTGYKAPAYSNRSGLAIGIDYAVK